MRGQETDQKVKQVDPQSIGDDVESLQEIDAQAVDSSHEDGSQPSSNGVGGGFVEIVLEFTIKLSSEMEERAGGRACDVVGVCRFHGGAC